MNLDVNSAKWYLAGMIDGEGTVTYPREGKKGTNYLISITSTDFELIDACARACCALQYYHIVRGPFSNGENRKDYWYLEITKRETLTRASLELPLQHNEKRERLKNLVLAYKRVWKDLTPEDLKSIRCSTGTYKEIANKFGISSTTVHDVINRKRAFTGT
jgi:hypothetical protein